LLPCRIVLRNAGGIALDAESLLISNTALKSHQVLPTVYDHVGIDSVQDPAAHWPPGNDRAVYEERLDNRKSSTLLI
jgi:hypothetical protein